MPASNVISLDGRRQREERGSVELTAGANALPTAINLHAHLTELIMKGYADNRKVLIEGIRRDESGCMWLDFVTFRDG